MLIEKKKIGRLIIVGCGLIGTSIALAARKNDVVNEIIGVEESLVDFKRSIKPFDRLEKNIGNNLEGDLVVLSVPVSEMKNFVPQLSKEIGTKFKVITEVGSTKRTLIESILSLKKEIKLRLLDSFVSSHPLCGSEKSGSVSASEDLFKDATVLISQMDPLRKSNDMDELLNTKPTVDFENEKNLKFVKEFWNSLGAKTLDFPIQRHDSFLALISHLPHLVSFTLSGTLSKSEFNNLAQGVNGKGLRDTSRISGSSPDLWVDILLDNKVYLIELMEQWDFYWEAMRKALVTSNKQTLKELLIEASSWRKNFNSKN